MAKVEIIDRDFGWKKLKGIFAETAAKPAAVRVGIQGGETPEGGNLSLVDIATVHEFGSADGRVPQRSFIRSTFDKNTRQYQKLVNTMAGAVLDGKTDAGNALGLIGQKFVADIKETIRGRIAPPLAESTLRARMRKVRALAGNKNQSAATAAVRAEEQGTPDAGAVTPLIDTGRLINSIRAVVEQ